MRLFNKKSLVFILSLLAAGFSLNVAVAADQPGSKAGETNTIQENSLSAGSFIKLEAASAAGKNLNKFLIQGANIVKKTEPETKYWFALKENDDTYAIFDAFKDEDGRTKHFEGKVAAALKEQAATLIEGGWHGVSENIHNYEILSYSTNNVKNSKEATIILLTAQSGKEKELEAFLKSGAQIIHETEDKTLFWAALKLDDNHFAIFDTFSDETGRKAHFNGKVAAGLKEKASELIAEGWDNGVLKNVHNMKVIAKAIH